MQMLPAKSKVVGLSLLVMLGALITYSGPLHAALSQENIGKELNTLLQWEIDNSYILGQAIDNLEYEKYRKAVMEIKNQCEDHMQQLSNLMSKYKINPPAHSRDFKGFFMQGYAAMRGIMTDHGVLEALHTNLALGNKAFERIEKLDLPEEVKTVVQKITVAKKNTLETVRKFKEERIF